jgi:hypothetical protein
LYSIGALLAAGSVNRERFRDAVAADVIKAAREDDRVFDRGCGTLRHVGCHRMARISE